MINRGAPVRARTEFPFIMPARPAVRGGPPVSRGPVPAPPAPRARGMRAVSVWGVTKNSMQQRSVTTISRAPSPTEGRTAVALHPAAGRMEQFDRVKAFCMWCVIWGHLIQYMRSDDAFADPAFCLIYSFHMPLFLCLAGWFSAKALQLPFPSFLLQQTRRLLLPVATWCVLLIVPLALCRTPFRWEHYAHALLWEYWFLRALFLCFVGTWAVVRLPRRWMRAGAALFLLLLTYRYYFSFAFAFFLTGFYMRPHARSLFRSHLVCTTVLSGILFGLLLVGWDGSCTVYLTPGVTWKNLLAEPQAAPGRLLVEIYRYATGLSGSLFLMGLAHSLFLRGRVAAVLQWMGRYTLGAYIMHIAFVLYTLPWLFTADALPRPLANWLLLPVAAFLLQLLLALLQQRMERSRIVGFLLFGRQLKTPQARGERGKMRNARIKTGRSFCFCGPWRAKEERRP